MNKQDASKASKKQKQKQRGGKVSVKKRTIKGSKGTKKSSSFKPKGFKKKPETTKKLVVKRKTVSEERLIKRFTKARRNFETAQANGYRFTSKQENLLSYERFKEEVSKDRIDRGYFNRLESYAKDPRDKAMSFHYMRDGEEKSFGLRGQNHQGKLQRAKRIEKQKQGYDKNYLLQKIRELFQDLLSESKFENVWLHKAPLMYSARSDRKLKRSDYVEYEPERDIEMFIQQIAQQTFSEINDKLQKLSQLITKIEAINYYDNYVFDVLRPAMAIFTGQSYETEYNPYESDVDPYGLDEYQDEFNTYIDTYYGTKKTKREQIE